MKSTSDSLTKQKLLDAAEELILSKGYAATSVEEVCTTAGLTKGSFFHYFDGKEDMAREVAQRFFEKMREGFQSAPFLQLPDPLDRVFGFVDYLIAKARDPKIAQGCLLGTLVQEISATHPNIRSVCASCFEQQTRWLQKELEEAKKLYAPDAHWNARSLAELFLAVAQGSFIVAKAKGDRKVIEESLAHFKEYLKSLCNR
jgi:TetR/AcrR family transcriptional repressor of nem operon